MRNTYLLIRWQKMEKKDILSLSEKMTYHRQVWYLRFLEHRRWCVDIRHEWLKLTFRRDLGSLTRLNALAWRWVLIYGNLTGNSRVWRGTGTESPRAFWILTLRGVFSWDKNLKSLSKGSQGDHGKAHMECWWKHQGNSTGGVVWSPRARDSGHLDDLL